MWCETLAFDEVVPLAPLLARYRLDLLLAVRPWHLDEAAAAISALRDRGVFVAVWPMLADDEGRWASVSSAESFAGFCDTVAERIPADELAIDLEPPIVRARHTMRGFGDARARLAQVIERWRPRRITSAIMPFLTAEVAGTWMQRAFGTPVTDLDVDRHSVMAYTSLYEGWSYRLVNRRRAEWALAATARLARSRFGARAALSLGTIGTGAFGNEPCYRDPRELARDVEIARDAGIDELSLFDLGGVVRRAPAEAWLDAFTGE